MHVPRLLPSVTCLAFFQANSRCEVSPGLNKSGNQAITSLTCRDVNKQRNCEIEW